VRPERSKHPRSCWGTEGTRASIHLQLDQRPLPCGGGQGASQAFSRDQKIKAVSWTKDCLESALANLSVAPEVQGEWFSPDRKENAGMALHPTSPRRHGNEYGLASMADRRQCLLSEEVGAEGGWTTGVCMGPGQKFTAAWQAPAREGFEAQDAPKEESTGGCLEQRPY
jgi:hypothetical protein